MKKKDNEHSSTDVSREEIKIFLIDGKKYNKEEIKNQFNIDDYKIQLIFDKFKRYPNQFKFNNENEVIPTVVGIFIFTEIKIHILIFPKNFNETDNNLNKDNFLIIFLTIRKYIEEDKKNKKTTNNTENENKDHIYEIFKTYFFSREMLSSALVKTDKICNDLTTEIARKFGNFFTKNEPETKLVVIDAWSNDIQQKIEHLKKLLDKTKPNEWKLIYMLIEYLKDQYLNRTIKFFVNTKKFDYLWQKVCETVYGNHRNDEIEQHKSLLKEKNKNKKQINDIFKSNKENGKDIIPDQILIFDNQKKIFVIDSKFYKDPTGIDGRKEWHYGFLIKQWLVHNSCKIFILFFIPSLSDKIQKHYFVDWIIHENYNDNDKLEKIDDFLLISWRVEISMIKIFQHYLISDKEKKNLADFNPLKKRAKRFRSN